MNKNQRDWLFRSIAAGLMIICFPASAQVDMGASSITTTAMQMGVPIDGVFRKFDASLDLNIKNPESGNVKVSVQTGSYDLGESMYNQQVLGKEWFDSAAFPEATFVSTSITRLANNKYNVAGKLSIKGTSHLVNFPVTIRQQGSVRIFDGLLPIRRTEFGIGVGEWRDTSVVADEVVVKFHISATGR